ncbi:MAG: hypothetical protein IT456_28540 [Planctomycetes bacterium]|nr:hypothetical protein [Planctomycetota bacterium]
MIHLYVDPVYGDDWSASSPSVSGFFNPDGGSLECWTGTPATPKAPHSILEYGGPNNWYGDPLRHAPHPFKTITGAIGYINRLAPAGGGAPLPHTDPDTHKTWAYCIIHLLPGWYGRSHVQGSSIQKSHDGSTGTHNDSRIVPNGETFPLHLPPRVSLAGTSALNTVIDTGQVGTAIEFGKVVNGVALNGFGTFIDKITFFACGGRTLTGGPEFNPRNCAAILLDDGVAAAPTISNCMFVKNVFGVLVNAQEQFPVPHGGVPYYGERHNGTTIINCTFAWNMWGVWNGQIDQGNDSIGLSKLNLVNNIFDGSETIDPTFALPCDHSVRRSSSQLLSWPQWQAQGGIQLSGIASAFEGVSQEDMRVIVNGTPTDFNAYEFYPGTNPILPTPDYNYNRQVAQISSRIAGLTPATAPRTGPAQFQPRPQCNLASITGYPFQAPSNVPGWPQVSRGVLFVSDLFCRGGVVGSSGIQPASAAGFDGSPLDMRLSPMVMPAAPSTSIAVPNALNPLVDAGFGGPFPATMENGNPLVRPGTLVGAGWAYDCFGADAEGYGNPRVHDHPAYASTAFANQAIDVGADELGELVVAGYRIGSTTFLRLNEGPGSAVGHPDLGGTNLNPQEHPTIANDRLYYLGPTATFAASVVQPDYRRLSHYSNAGGGQFPISVYPGSYGQLVTWHSAEDATTYYPLWGTGGAPLAVYALFSHARPYYALRTQDAAVGRQQPAPVLPPSPVPSGTPILDFLRALNDLGDAYRATAADVTPCLRPDVHPWWTEVAPMLGGLDLYTTSPAFPIWQDDAVCGSSNYLFNCSGLGARNWFLYDPPLGQDLNPAGCGGGFAVGSATYTWLDETAWVAGQVPVAARFDNWSSVPLAIANFNVWGVGGTTTTRSVLLPSTTVALVAPGQEAAALRFSLEWRSDVSLGQSAPRQPNVQSFLVVIDGVPVPQQPPQ